MAARPVVAALLVLVLVGGGLLASAGGARAFGVTIPYGIVAPDGSFILPNSRGLLSDTPLTPGSLVFGDQLDIIFFNPHGNRTIQVTSFQNGTPGIWLNQSFAVAGATATLFSFTLPSSQLTVDTRLCVDDACLAFLHKTPVTLFPLGVLTIGGLDVLAFAITAETLVLMVPLTLWARRLAHTAVWSPNIRWWLVLPHVVLGALLFIAADFPALDALFNGVEFAIFPILIAILWFWWCMHLFNRADAAEAFRPDPSNGHTLDFYRWRIIVGDLPDGRRVLIGTRWRDWLARCYGHAPVLIDPADKTPAKPIPAAARVATMRVETRDEEDDRKVKRWRRFRSLPDRRTPFDSFRVVNASILTYQEKDPPRLMYWVDFDKWLNVKMPYLSWHRTVKVEAEYGPDGKLTKRAGTKQKLTWPHYVDPPVVADLADLHWMDEVAAGLNWVAQCRSNRRVQQMRRENYVLRAGHYVVSDDLAATSTEEIFGLVHRERFGISLEEAKEEARHSETEKEETPSDQAPEGPEGPEGPGPTPDQEG